MTKFKKGDQVFLSLDGIVYEHNIRLVMIPRGINQEFKPLPPEYILDNTMKVKERDLFDNKEDAIQNAMEYCDNKLSQIEIEKKELEKQEQVFRNKRNGLQFKINHNENQWWVDYVSEKLRKMMGD